MRGFRAVLLLLTLTSLCGLAQADCSAPANPGVRICAPTPNSTVVYVAGLHFNSTPVSGAIHKFIVYDNNVKVFEGEPYQTGVTLYDAGIRNGRHNVVINAWDTDGHLLQSRVSFTVIGQGYPIFCAAPASPGINFCVPPANSVQPRWVPISVTATGYSRIAAINIYVDSQLAASNQGYNYLSTGTFPTTPGRHQLTAVAYDTTGHTFVARKTVLNTYDMLDCPPKGNAPCAPGFVIVYPFSDGFVSNSFSVRASVQNNSLPITSMKLYIDNTQFAQSNGPVMLQTINNAPNGTHVLTFQAWDTAGRLYRVQQNIHVNVPH